MLINISNPLINFAIMFVILILIFSVVIGSFLGYIFSKEEFLTKFLLTFSGAFFLAIAVLEIFPEVYLTDKSYIGLFVLAGLLFQMLVESLSKGAEHGHVHFKKNSSLPAGIFWGLFLHSFFEGTPLLNQYSHHLLWAIFIHNIPVAIVLFGAVWQMKISKLSKLSLIIVFALAGPLGALVGKNIPESLHQIMLAFVAGIFIHISTVILFESTASHKFKAQKILTVLLGFALAYLIVF